jgi:Short C-terminal domain
MSQKHGLGFGNGKIIEHDDGSAAYIKTGEFTQAFRVQVADVTGFSVTKSKKMLERRLHVLGNGTTLASVDVNHGTSEKIEAWFRSHPKFRPAPVVQVVDPLPARVGTSVADELQKLADLRAAGVLTGEEFGAAKGRLLAQ